MCPSVRHAGFCFAGEVGSPRAARFENLGLSRAYGTSALAPPRLPSWESGSSRITSNVREITLRPTAGNEVLLSPSALLKAEETCVFKSPSSNQSPAADMPLYSRPHRQMLLKIALCWLIVTLT